ncbi:MAG: acyl-CoA desaturase [Pyrinomonadaceae bacterium]
MEILNYIYWFSLFAYCFVFYLAAGLAINIAYHRGLSHRSFELKKPFERFFVLLGLPAGTPVQWVGNHRFHHRHTDENIDPHSPVKDGFWFAHNGWYTGTKNPFVCFLYSVAGPLRMIFDGWNRPRTNLQYNNLAADISGDKFYSFFSRPIPFMFACWLHVLIWFGFAYRVWGIFGFAALWVTLVFIYNIGDAIDSFAHLYGARPFAANHFARNNKWLGILTLGEGWHANHHVFPSSAKHGLLPNQFDAVWKIIGLFEKLKIIKNVRIPNAEQINSKLISFNTGEQQDA